MTEEKKPGLLQKLTETIRGHYVEKQAPATALEEPLFSRWAQETSRLGLQPGGRSERELLGSYRSWIYSAVRAISFRVASLPLELLLKTTTVEGVESQQLQTHPFLDLIWRPNAHTTRIELWLTTMNHLDLTGNAYWLILKDRLGIPREIWPLYPQFMRIIPDKINFIKGYIYNITHPPIQFGVNERDHQIVHFKYPNPMNPYYGVGPVEAQAMAHDLDLFQEVYQRNFFLDGGRPDFVVETDSRISKDDAFLFWELWDERHRGAAKSYRPGILGSGLKAKPLNVNNRDLMFAALADWSRDKILAAFGVPAAKLGLVVDVNRANAEAADLTFNREAILPRTMIVEERIEMNLLPAYPGQSDRIWLETDFEDPVPEDRELALKERESRLATFVTSINQEREMEEMPPVPWGETPIAPATVGPLVFAGAAPPGEEPPPEEEPEEPTPGDDETEPAPSPEEQEELRLVKWDEHVERITEVEEEFEKDVQLLFGKQEGEAVKALEENFRAIEGYFHGWSGKKVEKHLERDPSVIAAILLTIPDEDPEWTDVFGQHMLGAVDQAGLEAVAEIGVGVWDVANPRAEAFLRKQAAAKVVDVSKATRRALSKELTAGFAEGESVGSLATRIRGVFRKANRIRALTIARTETNAAANFGTLEGWKQTGIVAQKQWLTARDERVRTSHVSADGQKVPINDNFHVGGGQGQAPSQIGLPEEDINCRCTMRPVKEGETKPVTEPRKVNTMDGMRRFLGQKQTQIGAALGENPTVGRMDKFIKETVGVRGNRALVAKKLKPSDPLDSALKSLTKDAVDDVSKITSEATWRKAGPVRMARMGPGNNRANYRRGKSRTSFGQARIPTRQIDQSSRRDLRRKYLHELGHHIDDSSRGMNRNSKIFWQSRTQGESLVPLRSRFNSGYGLDELTKPDKFIDPYVGKVYPRATEIISMGLEQFIEPGRALSFWERDPQHFSFLHAVMMGQDFLDPGV